MRNITYPYRQKAPHRVVTHNPGHAWLEKNYPGFMHTIFMQGIHAGVFLMNKYFPFGFTVGYTYSITTPAGEEEIDWFWDARELERVRAIFLRNSKRTLKFFNKYYRWWEARHRSMLVAYRQAEQYDVTAMSDQKLYDMYETLYWENITQGAAGYLADCFLTAGEHDWLSEFIASRVGSVDHLPDIIATLTAPSIPTFSNEEEIALSRLASTVKKTFPSFRKFQQYCANNPRLDRKVQNHAARFYWVENNYFAKILTKDYFLRKLYHILSTPKSVSIMQTFARNRQQKRRLLKKLNDRWLANVITMAEHMTHVQDYRKMGLIRFSHYVQLIFAEMSQRTGLTVNDFRALIEPEIENVFLRRNIDKRMIRARRIKSFAYGTPKSFTIYVGKEVDRYIDRKQFHQDHSGITEVRGVPACSGKVRGIARMVRNAHTVRVFTTGDILITNNTTPEFVPLMKRAGAVVTDQGGITCHAAIISRELGIPCIIGTKIATHVFHDGDMVEVDAEKGIVKKLS